MLACLETGKAHWYLYRSRSDRKDTRLTTFPSRFVCVPLLQTPVILLDQFFCCSPQSLWSSTQKPNLEDFLRGSTVDCDWFSPTSIRPSIYPLQPKKFTNTNLKSEETKTCDPAPSVCVQSMHHSSAVAGNDSASTCKHSVFVWISENNEHLFLPQGRLVSADGRGVWVSQKLPAATKLIMV